MVSGSMVFGVTEKKTKNFQQMATRKSESCLEYIVMRNNFFFYIHRIYIEVATSDYN